MASHNRPLFTIIETEEFLNTLRLYFPSAKRWDEIKETIDLDLAKNPTIAHKIHGTYLYAIPLSTNPPLTIYYSVDSKKQTVTLLEIHRV
jgi:hypothetical protein